MKTDKGFKEVHITKAAKDVSQLVGYEVTTTQVTNHLRMWKTRYQRIEKLRGLSGALWDDDKKNDCSRRATLFGPHHGMYIQAEIDYHCFTAVTCYYSAEIYFSS